MFLFSIGLLVVLAALILPVVFKNHLASPLRWGAHIAGSLLGLLAIVWSTAIYVADNQGGLVIVKLFASDLDANRIVATNGEKGPQAQILPPGWHFGYWPWKYELHAVDNITIPEGHLGTVTALDGKPLPAGEVYAPEWSSPQEMIDGQRFLTTDGHRGPQITVLPPGQYRYNPRLFKIDTHRYLSVPVGKVAIIKANAGPTFKPEEGEVTRVNGTPIVPKGYRGIWNVALTPNAYYLHPFAFERTLVSTTNRVYEYTAKNGRAISVRTKDGFEFPVDVRVAIKVTADEAPLIVAQFAQPDDDLDNNGYSTLEERAILPSIRAIFRNNAEDKGALEYVAARSSVEKSANALFETSLEPYRIQSDGVFIQDIGLSDTEQGKQLLATQTDREVAKQQQTTYKEQVLAEQERAAKVKAQEDADQERLKAAAKAQIQIQTDEGQAKAALAKGEAEAWEAKIKALGGIENFTQLEMLRMTLERLGDKWTGQVPTVMVAGGSDNGSLDAVLGGILKEQAGKN